MPWRVLIILTIIKIMKKKKLVSVTCPELDGQELALITVGKTYDVFDEDETSFRIICDNGKLPSLCLKKGCAHLNGENWILNYE